MSYDPNQPYSSYGPERGEEATPPPSRAYEPTQYAGPPQYGLPYDTPPPPPPVGSVLVTSNISQYGVPPYGLPPQPPRRSLRWLWITLAIVAGVVILACSSCVLVGVIAALTASPDSTVNDYYSAIQQQDYSEAYSYLEADTLTIQGKKISPTESSFVLAAQVIDQEAGTVTSYSITSSHTSGDEATLVVHVTRSSGIAYDVHLTLIKIDSDWKITQLDNI